MTKLSIGTLNETYLMNFTKYLKVVREIKAKYFFLPGWKLYLLKLRQLSQHNIVNVPRVHIIVSEKLF